MKSANLNSPCPSPCASSRFPRACDPRSAPEPSNSACWGTGTARQGWGAGVPAPGLANNRWEAGGDPQLRTCSRARTPACSCSKTIRTPATTALPPSSFSLLLFCSVFLLESIVSHPSPSRLPSSQLLSSSILPSSLAFRLAFHQQSTTGHRRTFPSLLSRDIANVCFLQAGGQSGFAGLLPASPHHDFRSVVTSTNFACRRGGSPALLGSSPPPLITIFVPS